MQIKNPRKIHNESVWYFPASDIMAIYNEGTETFFVEIEVVGTDERFMMEMTSYPKDFKYGVKIGDF